MPSEGRNHMGSQDIAELILWALGGKGNVRACGVCATRLRFLVNNISAVDRESLADVRGVLGISRMGLYGIELVLGPGLVHDVSEDIGKLTGIRSTEDELSDFNNAVPVPGLSIRISTAKSIEKAPADDGDEDDGEDDVDADEEDDGDEEAVDAEDTEDDDDFDEFIRSVSEAEHEASLLIINGPNINMLGIREPDIYGVETYSRLLELCHEAAEDAGFASCTCLQSNHEGDLVDWIQQALGVYDAIAINPGAYTHTSIALLDALKAVQIPAVEVHISAVDEREPFRKVSYVRDACIATVAGRGIEGYRDAIGLLAAHLCI